MSCNYAMEVDKLLVAGCHEYVLECLNLVVPTSGSWAVSERNMA